jgi:hypothetical protein
MKHNSLKKTRTEIDAVTKIGFLALERETLIFLDGED